MRFLILVFTGLLFFSCKDTQKGYRNIEGDETELAIDESLIPGRKIVENECYICHSPEASEDVIIAPPMVAVKSHYIDAKTTKEEFSKALLDWLNDPQLEKVKMHGALRRFGIMPYQPYSEEDIEDIASYLYETDLPQPDWYEDHRRKHHGQRQGMGRGKNEVEAEENEPYFPRAAFYQENGRKITTTAQGVLGKNLVKAIQEKGTEGAISFCKVNAKGITDSVGIMNNVLVKRISDKPRNTANRASEEEKGFIIAFKRQVENQAENQGEIRPILKEMSNDEVYYYSPIITNAMCLQCHGTPEKEILEPVMLTLKTLYPEDKAVGYDAGQVRGMWRIQFVK